MNPADINYSLMIPGMNGSPSQNGGINPVNNWFQNKAQAPTSQMGMGGVGGVADPLGSGLGLNLDTAKLALGGLQTIGGLWNAWEMQKLAKQQFSFQKDITETNLANQIKSYNTNLSDRSRSRAAVEGQSPTVASKYIEDNMLRR